jgi:hypothetical protein
MNIENIFTEQELALIDSGEYKPGCAVLDAKLDLAAALEREACAKVCDVIYCDYCAGAIRARGNT